MEKKKKNWAREWLNYHHSLGFLRYFPTLRIPLYLDLFLFPWPGSLLSPWREDNKSSKNSLKIPAPSFEIIPQCPHHSSEESHKTEATEALWCYQRWVWNSSSSCGKILDHPCPWKDFVPPRTWWHQGENLVCSTPPQTLHPKITSHLPCLWNVTPKPLCSPPWCFQSLLFLCCSWGDQNAAAAGVGFLIFFSLKEWLHPFLFWKQPVKMAP